MENITITITKSVSEEGGFMYDIYSDDLTTAAHKEAVCEGAEDGGYCTSDDILDALGMATSQAIDLIKNSKQV